MNSLSQTVRKNEDIDEKRLKKFIDGIAKEQDYKDWVVIIKAVSSEGANFTSKLFKVKISAPIKPDLHLFAKVVTLGETVRQQTPIPIIDNEIFFYTKLIKVFEKLEKKYNVLEKHRLNIPKYYCANTIYLEEIIVLEDIGAKGYQSFNRFDIPDWGYASAGVEELAKLHAISIVYKEEEPSDFQNCLGSKQSGFLLAETFSVMLRSCIDQAIEVTSEENKQKLKDYFNNIDYIQKFKNFYTVLKRPVLTHVDYKPNNLMHKTEKDGSYKIAILDFQTFNVGCPITDLLFFIFTSTNEEFRRQHFNKLIEHYYTELGHALKRLNVDINVVYPKADFEYEFKEVLPYGLYISLIVLPVLTADPKEIPSISENMDALLIKGNSLYVERLNGVINDYVKWGLL